MNRIKKLALPFALGGLTLSAMAFAHGKEHRDTMFDEMDKNSDGKISADEHSEAAWKMFDKMDANGDGMVTEDEMTAYIATRKDAKAGKDKAGGEELSVREKIAELDTDGDGVLTAAEHRDGAKRMFRKMDSDRDGYLSKSEWDAGHQKLLKKVPST